MSRVVLDTHALIAGLRSKRGASFRLLEELGRGTFKITLSVPLVLEYEEILIRQASQLGLSKEDVESILDYLCRVANLQEVFFLWRPVLPDLKDDFVLEVAVAGGCDAIVTHNVRDFVGTRSFGIAVVRPGSFLNELKELK